MLGVEDRLVWTEHEAETAVKVRTKRYGYVFDVYAVYWKDDKTYFALFPKQTAGLTVYGEEGGDRGPALGPDFVFSSRGLNGFYHRYLIEHALLEPLFDHDAVAYKKFSSLLGREP